MGSSESLQVNHKTTLPNTKSMKEKQIKEVEEDLESTGS
jgi:hypothetical protein